MSTATRLQAYRDAETRVLLGQSVSIAGRTLTLADLATIRSGIAELERKLRLEANGAAGRGGHALADFSGSSC